METFNVAQSGSGGYSIVELIRRLDYENLKTILPIVQAELDRKNPETIERDRKMNEYWKQREQEAKEHEKLVANLISTLKPLLKPGVWLKMRGCKDGLGVREFVRWDGKNIVCWQIEKHALGYVNKRWEYEWRRGNIVTTHMADKVAGIYSGDHKTLVKIKEILAGKPVPA